MALPQTPLGLYKASLTPMQRLTTQAATPLQDAPTSEAAVTDPVEDGMSEAPEPTAALKDCCEPSLSPEQQQGMIDMIKARAEARKAASQEYQAKNMPLPARQ